MRRNLSLFSMMILVAASSLFAQTDATRTVVTPTDNQAGLRNPDMGWYLHYYDNSRNPQWTPPDNTWNDWPGLTTIYFRTDWGNIEPQQGQFAWNKIDDVANLWIALGRKIAFRITCLEGYSGATPSWANGGNYDPGNATWLTAWESFLSAFAARYDGKPYVAYVDMGSIGVWGEGHDGASDAVRKQHIDLYAKYFKNTQLVVNDDLGQVACEYGRQKGFTIRDDSPMWATCISTQVSYEPYWPVTPTIIETDWYQSCVSRGSWSDQCYSDVLEAYHASWIDDHGAYSTFWANEKPLINALNLRVGYRLQVTEASWPAAGLVGQIGARFILKWRNAGVAPCYKGGFPAITLKNASGAVAVTAVDTLFDVKRLQPGPKTTFGPVLADSIGVNLPANLAVGTYQVFISVGAKDGTPIYCLPYNNDDGSKRYPLGTIAVVAGNDNTPPTTPGATTAQPMTFQSIRLHWGASSDPESGIYQYLIFRDGVQVGRAFDTTFTDATLTEVQTYSYQISAMNNLGLESAKNASVSATTPADQIKPAIVSAIGQPGSLTILFSKPVEQASASTVSNYSITGGTAISAAALQADTRTVVLSTSAMTNQTIYTVTVNNVRDRAKTPNTIAANSTATFRFIAPITRVRYFPRPGYASRMVGGVFEGTNGPKDSGPYTPIYTIGNSPIDNVWTDVTSLSLTTMGFRYVRYRDMGGFCNVAEIEFYQSAAKVTGTVFGSPGSYGNSGNDYTKVFDGNTATFMDYTSSLGGYAGLDLAPSDAPVAVLPARCASAPGRISVSVNGRTINISGIHPGNSCSVALYDIRGNLVRMLSPNASATIDARDLATGRYIVKVKAGMFEATRMIMKY
jgi:hypothetical protein